MIEHISYDELFNENTSQTVYGVTDRAFLLLYNFYKSHSVENHYIVDISSTKVDDASVNLLRAYGIRFEDTASDTPEDKEYQFFIIPADVIDSRDSLMQYVGSVTVPGLLAGYGIVEKDYSDCKDYADSVLLSEVAPNIKVINPNFYKPTVSLYKSLDDNLQRLNNTQNYCTGNYFKPVNVSNLFADFNSTDINFYIESCINVLNRIESMNLSEDDILYIDNSISSALVKQAAMHIAAYLFIVYGIKWEFFNVVDNEIFRSLLAKARSSSYMFLDDYLNYLRNFPTFTASCSAGSGYICVKDENALSQTKLGYGIMLTLYRAKIDLKEWKLLQDFDKNKIVTPLKNINQIKRFRDLSDIGSKDCDAAFKAMKVLSDLFKEINNNLMDLSVLPANDLANINNVMIYSVGGTDYIAYVANIAGKLPFVIKPTVGNYPAFQSSYDVKELYGLHDIRLFFDAPKWYYKIAQAMHLRETDIKHMLYDKETAKGILLQGYLESNKTISLKHLSVAEVGVWSMQTGSFRAQNKNLFFELFNKRVALKNNMFTIFGVGHPQLGSNVVVTSDLWRYSNC